MQKLYPALFVFLAACEPSKATPDAAGPSPSVAALQQSAAPRASTLAAAPTPTLPNPTLPPWDRSTASKLIALSLACVDKEYPHKPDHVLLDEASLRKPHENHPTFFGCFDWHSAVHGHWSLVRVMRLFPDLPEAESIRKVLRAHLTEAKLTKEHAFFQRDGGLFERPYGWGWLLRLSLELHLVKGEEARAWEKALSPLATLLAERLRSYLEKLSVPVRAGTHANTAFSLAHALDYARGVGDKKLEEVIVQRASAYYEKDKDCPTSYEPSGEDFVSPCLAEADLMRRILPRETFRPWLEAFLPSESWSSLERIPELRDPKDPRIGHLIGLSLQRAWCFAGLAPAFDNGDVRALRLRAAASKHGVHAQHQMGESGYGGAHWLSSFAIFLLSAERGS